MRLWMYSLRLSLYGIVCYLHAGVVRCGKLIAAGRSWIGNVRSRNEDVALIRPERNLLAVADGMGGRNGGHIAARVAIDEIVDSVPVRVENESQLSDATERANKLVFRRAQENPDLSGMGATIVVMTIVDDAAVFCHVGDSRGYLFRDSKIEQLTKDHSVVQEQVDRGLITPDEARHALNRSVVTQAIGPSMVISPTTTQCKIQPEDIFLLCSDGLSDFVEEGVMQDILSTNGGNLRKAVASLIDEAADQGSTDNITAVVGKID